MKYVQLMVLLFSLKMGFSQDTSFYVNGLPSVVQSEWKNHHRLSHFFDLKGSLTFTLEEVNLSYRSLAKFHYYENGGVKEVVVHTSPGSSRYHYKTNIRFDSTNYPLTKTEEKIPADNPEDRGGEIWFWNRKKKEWIKQEVVSCQPYQPR
jgi:hypothetical protein